MASGRRHWRARLARLGRVRDLSRSGRRQLRKLLGRAYACEWRLFGNIRRRDGSRSAHPDPLNTLIARNVQENGHVAQRLKAESGRRPQDA